MMFNRIYAIPLALVMWAGTIEIAKPSVLVPAKPKTTQNLISQRYQNRTIQAVSGPDEQGRWRFYKPDDVSDSAMRGQGCINVGSKVAQPWRCPSQRIRIQLSNNNYNGGNYNGNYNGGNGGNYNGNYNGGNGGNYNGNYNGGNGGNYGNRRTRTIQAVSGPDEQGRWRFYKPDDVSDSAMRDQGCVNVGSKVAQPWRCPSQRIRLRQN